MTAEILAAQVSSTVAVADFSRLIQQVHRALSDVATGATAAPRPLTPAVPIKKSVSPEYLTWLENDR